MDKARKRFRIIIILLILLLGVLLWRITKLMFFHKAILSAVPSQVNLSERGFILDRNGEKLALSLETLSVYARPSEIENKKETATELARVLGTRYDRVLRMINTNKPFVWIERQVDIALIPSFDELDLKGIYTEKEFRRYYPFGNLASHVIGFAGIDQEGLEGIEYQFDEVLLPRKREERPEAHGGEETTRGYSVVLTIDRYVQEIVEEELAASYAQTGAQLITALVMRPDTGEILALSNKPDYDLNRFGNYPDDLIRNKAITDSFEPGSTFKIFISSILFDSGLIDEDDTFECSGEIDVGKVTIHDTGEHGIVNPRQILERSCNVGMVLSVDRIGKSDLFEKLRAFGFGTPTGINLPGEARGILRNPGEWSMLSKYVIAIGQEVSSTPLQIITAAGAIANDGVLMQPRIVKSIERPDGTLIKEYVPLQIRRVLSSETANRMLDILTGVLSDRGTGYNARIEGYSMAGKTGTAQIADREKGGYLEGQFYASFIGFLPVPEPKIVVLVTLDRPTGESYGGQTAAPVFKHIVERIAPYLNIYPSSTKVYILNDADK